MESTKSNYIKDRTYLTPFQFIQKYFFEKSNIQDIKNNFQTYFMIYCQVKGVDINSLYNSLTSELDVKHNITLTIYEDKIINIC